MDQAEILYRPGAVWRWMQLGVAMFMLAIPILAALLIATDHHNRDTFAVGGLLALILWPCAIFIFLIYLGFRRLEIRLRDGGLAFVLPRLGISLLFPWRLTAMEVSWPDVRAVDVKLRTMGSSGSQRIFIIRTRDRGDYCFVWPQWSEADAIAAAITRRSGAISSIENMDLPPPAAPLDNPSDGRGQPALLEPGKISKSERAVRWFGTGMLAVTVILWLLCVLALFGCKPEERWEFGRAIVYLSIAGAGAQSLRRYRRIR